MTASPILWPSGVRTETELVPAELALLDQVFHDPLSPPALVAGVARRETVEHRLKRPFDLRSGVFPSLPASVAFRAATISELGSSALWLGDCDDAASLARCESVVVDNALDGSPIERVSRDAVRGSFDTVVLDACAIDRFIDELCFATAHLKREGTLAIRVRAPFDLIVSGLAKTLNLSLRHYYREVDQRFVPPGLVLDGGADLVVFERPDESALRALSKDDIFFKPVHAWRDFDGLTEHVASKAKLEAWSAKISERWHVPFVQHELIVEEGRCFAAFNEASGQGFNVEFRSEERHALLSFAPYEPTHELLAIATTAECFAGPTTRTRPIRTGRTPVETLFG